MSNHRVYLDDIYASEACQGSTFRAVVMMAHEARFINDQANQGYLNLTMKPTTIAMDKFKDNKLTMLSRAEAEERKARQEAAESEAETPTQGGANTDEAANDAFGF